MNLANNGQNLLFDNLQNNESYCYTLSIHWSQGRSLMILLNKSHEESVIVTKMNKLGFDVIVFAKKLHTHANASKITNSACSSKSG